MPPSNDQALVNDRLLRQLDALDQRMASAEKLNRDILRIVTSTDPREPGALLRIDRMERAFRFVAWLGTGGLTGIAGTLFLLWRILEAVGHPS